MKFSEQWLREWVNPGLNTEQLAEQLTMLGHEVDAVEPAAPDLSDVLVAKVISAKPHPDADRLTLCEVDYGTGTNVEVVCGAPNVCADGYYPYVPVGAVLPNGMQIAVTDIKGVTSNGMLCSAAELELSDKSDGLLELQSDAKAGQALTDYLQLDDQLIEVSLTPNRGDCLSIRGLARDLAASNKLELQVVDIQAVAKESTSSRTITLPAAEGCPRYVGRVIEGVDLTKPSPSWLQEKLRRAGVRSLSAIVDITNYVMLELGQPMHAFDNDKLEGDIGVRYSEAGESITLLNGEGYDLPEGSLLIIDASGPVAMAGVMGGEKTAVSDSTQNIFLESAFFTPIAIAGRARQLGLHTDASHRYERGVDPSLQAIAVERATALVLEICGGKPGPVTEACIEKHLPPTAEIELPYSQVASLLGKSIEADEINEIISSLGIQVIEKNDEKIQVRVPSWRFDLSLPEDLIEEVARIHGFQQFPSELPQISLAMRQTGESSRLMGLKQVLVERGFQEVISYSFVENSFQKQLFPKETSIELMNAISPELAVMRVSLWPGLLNTLIHNLNRQQPRLRIFELGRVFTYEPELKQDQKLGGLIYGNIYHEQWDNPYTSSDIFDLKADVEALIRQYCGPVTVSYDSCQAEALHPGQAAAIVVENQVVGILGALHPGIQKSLDIDNLVYLFEINIEKISPKSRLKYAKISKFPSTRRDLSIIVDEQISIENIQSCIKKCANELLTNLELFDVYQGEGIDLGKKSVTLGLTFQRTSSTLTDEEVEGIKESVIESLRNEFNARLRE